MKHLKITKNLLLIFLLFIGMSASAQTIPCKADFDFRVDQNSKTVKLSAKSNHQPAKFAYYLGDGSFERGQEIKYTYASAGDYEVCLVVIAFNSTTNQRCTTKVCKKVQIVDCDRLNTRFSVETDGLTVKVRGETNSNNVSTGFTFGDGTGERGLEAKHKFSEPGTYTICFIAEDLTYGCRKEVCQKVIVRKEQCTIIGGFKSETDGLKANFKARSNEDNVHFFWSFGDGEDATGERTSHKYKKEGIYQVTLIVFNPRTKCQDVICQRVVVEKPCGLRVVLGARVDEEVAYLAARTNASRNSTYYWDFGDGNTLSTKRSKVKHSYKKKGTYRVTLIVSDRIRGCRKSIVTRVTIGPKQLIPNQLYTTPAVSTDDTEEIEVNQEDTWSAVASPSPARDVVSFTSEDKSIASVKVYNANGVIVVEQSTSIKELDISSLEKGFYYAHVTAADGTISVIKFIKD